MPLDADAQFTYDILEDCSLGYAMMTGKLTGEDMLHIVETVHNDPRWRSGYDAIWDCSRVTAHIVMPGDVTPIIDETVEGETGRDILIESPSVAGTLIAQLVALRSRIRGKEVHVVATLDEAWQSLGFETIPRALMQASS